MPDSLLLSSDDLAELAATIHCLTGALDCRCHGGIAVDAVNLAAGHLRAQRPVEAAVKLSHAAYVLPWPPIVAAHARLSAELEAQPDEVEAVSL